MLGFLPRRVGDPASHNTASTLSLPASKTRNRLLCPVKPESGSANASSKVLLSVKAEFCCVKAAEVLTLSCAAVHSKGISAPQAQFSIPDNRGKFLLPVRPKFRWGRRLPGTFEPRLCDSAIALGSRVSNGLEVPEGLVQEPARSRGLAEVESSRVVVAHSRKGVSSFGVSMADVEGGMRQEGLPRSGKLLPVKLGEFSIEGISIGGHETCVMIPGMKIAFDIGRCPQRAISQDFLFISHAHMDHIGGIATYVATRGLYKMKPPTVVVPNCIKATVEKLIAVYRELDGSELALRLVGLDIGEEYDMGKGYVVKPFRTYHVVPSQGYVVYSVKKKLKPEYLHLSGPEIKNLKFSGVEIIDIIKIPLVAFTGDTTADFIVDEANVDALKANLLIMEATFVDDAVTVEHARDYGHIHLFEVAALSSQFQNKNILLIHFSARYEQEEIVMAIKNLPKEFEGRVAPLLEGF